METNEKESSNEKWQCQFWLLRKNRLCAAASLPGLKYCGNHKPSTAQIRVPCPLDPSHTILQKEVSAHTRRCPAFKQLCMLEQQHYYCKGVNAGSDVEDNIISSQQQQLWYKSNGGTGAGDGMMQNKGEMKNNTTEQRWKMQELPADNEACSPKLHWSACMKRKALCSMSMNDFKELIHKIRHANELHCHEGKDESFQRPLACRKWMNLELDRRIPFKEKHALQQASLLGNLEAYGLIRSPNTDVSTVGINDDMEKRQEQSLREGAVVEFGAGRGYLTHMLADCYGVENAVLVERRSYKFKADRTLRDKQTLSLERLRIDIEDLDLKGVGSLQGRHYVAVSKHLCGPATDLALRCCLVGCKHLQDSEEKITLRHVQQKADGCAEPWLDGIGIATCCHHLCQWKTFVNKKFFTDLGFSKQEFNILTWMTSWAVLGGEHTYSNEASDSQPPDDANEAVVGDIVGLLGPAERFSLGLKCKLLVDIGRLHWLRQMGMDAKLIAYVPSSISPENKLIIARWTTRCKSNGQ